MSRGPLRKSCSRRRPKKRRRKLRRTPEVEKAKEAIMNLLREKGKALSHKFIVKKLSSEFDEEIIEEAITQLLADGEIYEPEIGFYEPL